MNFLYDVFLRRKIFYVKRLKIYNIEDKLFFNANIASCITFYLKEVYKHLGYFVIFIKHWLFKHYFNIFMKNVHQNIFRACLSSVEIHINARVSYSEAKNK